MIRWLALLPALLASAPVLAKPGPYAEIGGWTIVRDSDNCAIYMEYEGPGKTELFVSEATDGQVFLIVLNSGWSAKEGEAYPIRIVLDDTAYASETGAKGVARSYRRGFAFKMPMEFTDKLARAGDLHVWLGDQRIDQLSLKGSAAAVSSMRRCLGIVRRNLAARKAEEARWAHLPRDPFADATPLAPAKEPKAPAPRGNPARWVNLNDYPSESLRLEQSGRVEFKLTINAAGRVSDCIVTRSSGYTALDTATCKLMLRRGRFSPAIDENGNEAPGSYSSSVTWTPPFDPEP